MLTTHFALPNECGKHILYTYIRKNACSSFKRHMDFRVIDKTGGGLAKYKEFKIDAKNYNWREFDVRIFVYRDPVDRVISAFVNKFVEGRGASDIIEKTLTAGSAGLKEFTFEDFCKHIIAAHDFRSLDPHLWPQAAHLLDVEYTHQIPIGRLYEQMSEILAPGSAEAFCTRVNASGGSGQRFDGDLSAATVEEIQDLMADGKRLSKGNFRTSSLVEALEARYEQDFAMIKRIEEGSRARPTSAWGATSFPRETRTSAQNRR